MSMPEMPGEPHSPWLAQAHTIHRVVQVNVRRVLALTLLWGLGFALLLAVPFAMYYQSETHGYKSVLQAEKERVIRLAAEIIHQEMESALSDLRFLAQNNEIRAFLAGDTLASRQALAREFEGFARQKRLYDQVRFIGLDGGERVRVNFHDGRLRIVPEQELQSKNDRPYFRDAIRLDITDIHVSPLDLNIENGMLEQPYKPVIRFAIPVADAGGRKRGVVVLNYLGRRLLERLAQLGGAAGELWLTDSRGFWLLAPSPDMAWGFARSGRDRQTLSVLHPALWRQMSRREKGGHSVSGDWVQFERIYPFLPARPPPERHSAEPVAARDYYWTVTTIIPAEVSQAGYGGVAGKLGAIYGAWVLLGFALAGGMSFLGNRNEALAHVMESVIDNLPVLISYVDGERRYRFNNMAYERFFGLSPKQLFGKTMREVLGEESYLEVLPYVEKALAGETVTLELRLRYARAGMHDVVISYIPDIDPGGRVKGFYVLVNDVTPIRESERREHQHMLELAHVSRMASLGEMASEIAHEINQPLAAIAMFSAASLRSLEPGGNEAQLKTWLEAMNTQAKRASEVVRHLRRFVRKGDIHPGPVDLNQAAREVAGLMRFEVARHKVAIELDLAEGMPTLSAELILMEQVLFNLVRNALEALVRQDGEKRVTVRTRHDEAQVRVEVEDNGPGVDAALGDRIFESFMTGKRDGLGMGLAISRSIVEAHGGTLDYLNNPLGGATFRCCLPREAKHV